MSSELPDTLKRYFAAQNRHDIEALVACFAADAVVRDEGEDIIGTEAIRSWKEATSAKYRVTVAPLECRAEEGRAVVLAKVSGSFPRQSPEPHLSLRLRRQRPDRRAHGRLTGDRPVIARSLAPDRLGKAGAPGIRSGRRCAATNRARIA